MCHITKVARPRSVVEERSGRGLFMFSTLTNRTMEIGEAKATYIRFQLYCIFIMHSPIENPGTLLFFTEISVKKYLMSTGTISAAVGIIVRLYRDSLAQIDHVYAGYASASAEKHIVRP